MTCTHARESFPGKERVVSGATTAPHGSTCSLSALRVHDTATPPLESGRCASHRARQARLLHHQQNASPSHSRARLAGTDYKSSATVLRPRIQTRRPSSLQVEPHLSAAEPFSNQMLTRDERYTFRSTRLKQHPQPQPNKPTRVPRSCTPSPVFHSRTTLFSHDAVGTSTKSWIRARADAVLPSENSYSGYAEKRSAGSTAY